MLPIDLSDNLSDYAAMNTHTSLIEQLGGGTEVARALTALTGEDVDREAVYQWRIRNRVPWKWQPPLSILARSKNIELPSGFLVAPEQEHGQTNARVGQ